MADNIENIELQLQQEENAEAKKLLALLAIFPSGEIPLEVYQTAFADKNIEASLDSLVTLGCLDKQNNNYLLADYVKAFMLENHKPSYEEVKEVFKNIGAFIDPSDSSIIASKLSHYIPIIESMLALFSSHVEPEIIGLIDSKTFLHYALSAYTKAIETQEDALIMRQRLYGEVSVETVISYDLLGVIYSAQMAYDKAEPLFEKGRNIREQILGENHSDTATSYNNLATLYESRGEDDKAEKLYEKALRIKEELLGENHNDTLSSYNNLALLYKSKGEFDKAQALYEKVLKVRETLLGEKHPETASSYNNLGFLYKEQKKCKEALVYLEKALNIVDEFGHSILSIIELHKTIKEIEKDIKQEQKAKFNKKGRFCKDS